MGEKRPRSFYFLALFFVAYVLFLYGPMFAIYILSFQGPDGRGGLAQGNVRGQIERDGDGGKDARVVHRQRRGARLGRRDGEERRHGIGAGSPGGGRGCVGVEIERVQAFGRLPIGGRRLQHDEVLIERRVNHGDFRLAERGIEQFIE